MNSSELVTIVTPSYNSKKHIKQTVISVLNQSYPNFEMIIVDDCSTDGSAAFINDLLPDNRFKLITLDVNIGAAEARNRAIELAKGRYLAFLDSDDIWHPDKLKTQINFMSCNNIAFSFSSYNLIDESGRELNKVIYAPYSIDHKQYLKNTIIGCLTVMIDRNMVAPFKMPNLKSSHDMALWYEIMKGNNIKAYGANDVLASYRLLSTSNTSNKFKAAKDVWKVYRGYLRLGLITSAWYFVNYALNAIKKRVL